MRANSKSIRFKKVFSLVCAAIIIAVNFTSLQAFAFDKTFYSSNNINFYNPDACVSTAATDTGASGTAASDTVKKADKTYGTGPVTPGAGHSWKPAIASSFGGKGEYQSTAFGENTKTMDDNGVFYFAILPKDYPGLGMNSNTPKVIQDAVKSGKLKPKGKLIFKNGDKYAIGAWLDVGPGATGGGRWLDLGQSLNSYLGSPWKMQWDFVGSADGTAAPVADSSSASLTATTASCVSSSTSSTSAGQHGWDLTGTNAMVFYDQCSSPWVNDKFGSGSLCKCGCGPTSLAMIVATLSGDKSVNPENMAAFYASHGGQDSGCGSTWNWSVVSTKYPVKVTDLGTSLTKAKEVLDRGGLVLFSWSGAPFTGGGHIMVMRKYDTNGKIYIASSGGSTNRKQSDQAWDESIFTKGYSGPSVSGRGSSGYLKGLWGFEKKGIST